MKDDCDIIISSILLINMAGHTMYSINDLSLTARSQLLIQIIISILYNVCSYYYIIFSDRCYLLFFCSKGGF